MRMAAVEARVAAVEAERRRAAVERVIIVVLGAACVGIYQCFNKLIFHIFFSGLKFDTRVSFFGIEDGVPFRLAVAGVCVERIKILVARIFGVFAFALNQVGGDLKHFVAALLERLLLSVEFVAAAVVADVANGAITAVEAGRRR